MKGETTRDGAPPALTGLSPVAALVRRHDPDRYRAALFAPAGRREALFALYAFNHEIARVRESVTTPMLGQIRLQWWREAIEEAYSGQPARHHLVAEPLTAMIRGLAPSRAHFDRLIDARERDLADEPFANLSALEDYAEATSATVIRLALELLGVDAPATETAAREIGIAHALIGLLRAMPLHVPAGRCYIPDAIAADAGLDPGDYAALRATPGLRQAVAAVAAAAARHLDATRQQRAALPRAALPALLPAIAAERGMARLRRAGWNPFDPLVGAPDPLLIWRMTGAMLRRRFWLSVP